jgi:hypothetical protein
MATFKSISKTLCVEFEEISLNSEFLSKNTQVQKKNV